MKPEAQHGGGAAEDVVETQVGVQLTVQVETAQQVQARILRIVEVRREMRPLRPAPIQAGADVRRVHSQPEPGVPRLPAADLEALAVLRVEAVRLARVEDPEAPE